MSSLVDDSNGATVLRPGGLVGTEDGRTLLAVGHRADALGRNAERNQEAAGRTGATLAEGEVVLTRAALVAMPLDCHGGLGVLLQPGGLALERAPCFGLQVGTVEVEEHAVAD